MKYLWILPILLIAGCSSPTDSSAPCSIGWVGATAANAPNNHHVITVYADIFGGGSEAPGDVFSIALIVHTGGGDYYDQYDTYYDSIPSAGLRASYGFDLTSDEGDSGDTFSYYVQWGNAASDTYTGTLP